VLAAMAAMAASSAQAQTTGDSNAGQQLFTTTLSPQCSGCHSTTTASAANSLTAIRNAITNRAQPGGAAGTMNFAKALEALNAALNGTTLGSAASGMGMLYPTLTSQQRGDLAAYIAGLAGPAPLLRYAPASGPIFPATAVGASSSQTVTITNAGTAPLVFQTNNAVTIASGGDTADFRVTATSCAGTTLNPNSGNCTINVTFTPAAGANLTRTASIGLATSAGNSLVPMSGSVSTGTPPAGGSAAVPPASGGGGALPAAWALLLAAAALARVRRISGS
jgi:mono/diheme cytochrome c family protein